MSSSSTAAIKIEGADFLKIFKNRRPDQPVLTNNILVTELYKNKVTKTKIHHSTLDKNLKDFLYDEETNPSGFIMVADDSLAKSSMYYLKGEEMVYVDPYRKTLTDLIAMHEKFVPLVKRVTTFFVVVSLVVRGGQYFGMIPQDLGLLEMLTLHPIFLLWVGGMVAGVSYLGDYIGKSGMKNIPLNERLDHEYKAIPWTWRNILKKIFKQLDNVFKLIGLDLRGVCEWRYLKWGLFMVAVTGIGAGFNPEGPLFQFSIEWLPYGVIYGVYIVLTMAIAATLLTSGLGAFFEVRDSFRKKKGVS